MGFLTKQVPSINVYALAPHPGDWNNQHLLKDVGIIPYMLHKVFGYNVTLVTNKHGDYPYLDKYLPGIDMEFLPQNNQPYENKLIDYIKLHYEKMDLLILTGPYPSYYSIVKPYRSLRPDGKIYIGLDANSFWIDRLLWANPEFMQFLDHCNVIATSCRKMQRFLNKKWPFWSIEYIPNPFFNASLKKINVYPEKKENIILTVARIGIYEKANHLLLEAFAAIHMMIPDWNLRLVGPIDPSFEPYIAEYFSKYPILRNKVSFLGLIESKEDLYGEYQKAKIFVMTSVCEGGTPNVIAEALFHGCYIVTSNIDAAEDIVDNGACGTIFSIGNVPALQKALLKACAEVQSSNEYIEHSIDNAKRNFDSDLIIRKVHFLLFESQEGEYGNID